MTDEVGAGGVPDRRDVDVDGLAHRPGVERADLAQLLDRSCRRSGPCAWSRRRARGRSRRPPPRATSRYSSKSLPTLPTSTGEPAELRDGVTDVRRDAAATHVQLVDQERQRHLVQVIGEQLVGELAREVHQVVGRDGPGYEDRHWGNATSCDGCDGRGLGGRGRFSRRSCCRRRSRRRRWGCRW